jgi:hemin uptake protein HemP
MVDSQTLLNGDTVLLIRHLGEIYRLQTTRQGKLILTK